MHAWKQQGPPDRPAAWLHRAAKNRVLDALRRERVHEQALAHAGSALPAEQALLDDWLADERLPDSLLRMMFVGCHPALDRPTRRAQQHADQPGLAVRQHDLGAVAAHHPASQVELTGHER